ncbi:MAG TPA: hypothetical protein VJC03_05120, partial [bacterium]|nr:hypothetical protein [bacterium]
RRHISIVMFSGGMDLFKKMVERGGVNAGMLLPSLIKLDEFQHIPGHKTADRTRTVAGYFHGFVRPDKEPCGLYNSSFLLKINPGNPGYFFCIQTASNRVADSYFLDQFSCLFNWIY